ncbi:MAB_1171c family putative transporter [Streptomyces mirabilis]|uniref:MAB_1171c family putative transporter n=1 Tax=Streptomyces mirabilis TaxID=68239 RepID=UPI0033E4E36C
MKPTSLYLVPVVGLCIAFIVHLPVRRKWRVPVIRSGYAVLLIGALTLFHSQPPVIEEVNALTGISNFSAPLVYALNTTFSGACLALVINWRGGEPARIRQAWLLCLSVYSVCTAMVVLLFALGDAPVERTTDFDTYYATTPYIREMILLYLVAHSIAILIMMRLCLTWQREVRGLLRTGLILIVIGCWFDLGFQLSKYTAVIARGFGYNLDFFSTSVSPVMVSIAAVLVAAGFTLPRAGGQWDSLAVYRALDPLWSAVRHISIPIQPIAHWWQLPAERLTLRLTNVHDAVLRLHPHFNETVRSTTHAEALARGKTPDEAAVLAEAAVVLDAIHSYSQDAPPTNEAGTYKLQATQGSVRELVALSQTLRPQLPGEATGHEPASSTQA